MKKEDNADFVYAGTMRFDPDFTPFDPLEYEKVKYKKGILPKLKELEEELKGKRKEEISDEKVKEFLLKTKENHRTIKFQYENGEVYPKEIPFPNIELIQYPEPHVLITDLYDEDCDWYKLRSIISSFAEESYLSYEMGFWFASISSAINCCEYILKYELLCHLKKNNSPDLKKVSKDYHLTLGKIKDNVYNSLDLLKIKSLFYDKIEYLNLVRNSIYHFNPELMKKVNDKGVLEIEKLAPITDPHSQPIIAFRVYSIMMELINYFYNKKNSLKNLKECIEDWKKKRNLSEDDLN